MRSPSFEMALFFIIGAETIFSTNFGDQLARKKY